MQDVALLIVGGGRGSRFGGEGKLFAELGGRPLFLYALERLGRAVRPGHVIFVAPEDQLERFRICAMHSLPDLPILFVPGGAERSDSVRNGLAAIPETAAYVAIHDAARPFATAHLLERCVRTARKVGGVVPGRRCTDTIKIAGADLLVESTPQRNKLFAVETPQVFALDKLREAYKRMAGWVFTDDAAVMEAARFPVAIELHDSMNLKITYPVDLAMASWMLESGIIAD